MGGGGPVFCLCGPWVGGPLVTAHCPTCLRAKREPMRCPTWDPEAGGGPGQPVRHSVSVCRAYTSILRPSLRCPLLEGGTLR